MGIVVLLLGFFILIQRFHKALQGLSCYTKEWFQLSLQREANVKEVNIIVITWTISQILIMVVLQVVYESVESRTSKNQSSPLTIFTQHELNSDPKALAVHCSYLNIYCFCCHFISVQTFTCQGGKWSPANHGNTKLKWEHTPDRTHTHTDSHLGAIKSSQFTYQLRGRKETNPV